MNSFGKIVWSGKYYQVRSAYSGGPFMVRGLISGMYPDTLCSELLPAIELAHHLDRGGKTNES